MPSTLTRRRTLPLVALLLAGMVLLATSPGGAQGLDEDDDPAPPPVPLTGDELRNLGYPNDWPTDGVAPLSDGVYTEPIPDSAAHVGVEFRRAAFGRLGGRDAAAVVLATSGGGSGTFYELHVVTRDAAGAAQSIARHMIGDRIRLQGLAFDHDTIRVDFTGHGADDGLCCPTRNITHVFGLSNGALQVVRAAEAPAVQAVEEGPTFLAWFRGHTTSGAILASAGALESVQVFDPAAETWTADSRGLPVDMRPSLPVDPGTLLIVQAREATEIPVPLLPAPAPCPRNPGPADPLDPSMIVHGPGNGETFAGAVAVSGVARAFEANVRVRILDPSGGVLADTFTTASVGGPDFGDFAADIPVTVEEETAACVQIFEESARDGTMVNVVQTGVRLLPGLPADFPLALAYPGATVLSDSRSSNDEGETFVSVELAVDADTATILAYYARAFATLDAPGQVFDGYTGPNDTPSIYLALQDVSYAAAALIHEGAGPGGAARVEVTINLNPPGA